MQLKNIPVGFEIYNVEITPNKGGQVVRSAGQSAKLVSLDGFFNKPGIYEVDMGYSFSDLVKKAGGFSKEIKALQVGGPLGGVFPVEKILELNL